MKIFLLFVLLLVAVAFQLVDAGVLYTRSVVPRPWIKGVEAPADAQVEFTLALKQRNLDILDKWFWEASDPSGARYQEFRSIEEINDLVSPLPKEKKKVMAWLHKNGVSASQIRDLGDSLEVSTSAERAGLLFDTKFHVYKHEESGAEIVRNWGDYSIPHNLHGVVEMVTGISTFPIPHLRVKRGQNSSAVSNDAGIIPQTIDNLYSISQEARAMINKLRHKHHKLAKAGMTAPYTDQGVIEFQGQNYAPADLTSFGTGVSEKIQSVSAAHTVGPNDPTNPQLEASLDIQMVAGVNLGAQNWFWLENGQGWLYQFATHFFNTKNVPQVNSISYGWWEGDQCTIAPDECQQLGVDSVQYTSRVNTEFQKIGLRGITLVASSGDSGANGRTDPDCSIPRLRPAFPATSPYITAVGATEIPNPEFKLPSQPPICANSGFQCASGGKEQAVSYAISNFASGGGFSDIAPMPDYQVSAVNAYLKSGVKLPPSSYFNATGRAMPDIAANGHNALIVDAGQSTPVGGTSQSAPIIASIISLLNVAQIEKTGKPFGFINPFLYKMASEAYTSTFTDITVGDNKCTEDGCGWGCQGFLCYKGWDPVTGLGVPNFAGMLKYVQKQTYPNKRK